MADVAPEFEISSTTAQPVDIRNITGMIVPLTPSRGAFIDRSGTTLANTSKQVMAANATRSYLLFQNLANVTMWLNFTSAAANAAGSIEITPGAMYSLEGPFISTEAVNVFATTGNAVYTAKEF